MFTLKGNEFSSLIHREFVQNFSVLETSGSLPGKFECKSKNIREENFDILFLTSDFQEDTRVEQLQDTTHVSLHFQIKGHSEADISGLKPGMGMYGGQFNLINCIDPISSFTFPKQKNYEYICVGLKPDFFNNVLAECGADYNKLLSNSLKGDSFSLFKTNKVINPFQFGALRLMQDPFLSESLKAPFLRSKVKELIFLTLNEYSEISNTDVNVIKPCDADRLHSLKEFLQQHYLLPQTLEKLAKDFLLNEFKLKSGFKQLFGMSVFKYIQFLRLEHAHTLLLNGGITVGETATLIGYESDASFVRAFKTLYGYSPGKIRKTGKLL